MPRALINLDALSHNAAIVAACQRQWQVQVLPVLKAMATHPTVAAEISPHGFSRFGIAELPEALPNRDEQGQRGLDNVLINLSLTEQADLVVSRCRRSMVSTSEQALALHQACRRLRRPHEVLIMVNLGDQREGIEPEDFASLADRILAIAPQKNHRQRQPGSMAPGGGLGLTGLAVSLGCLGHGVPNTTVTPQLKALRQLLQTRGIDAPEVSVGGSIFYAWLAHHAPGPITEIRMGDPFLLGYDIYHDQPLPGGPYRRDAFLLVASILEIRTRALTVSKQDTLHHYYRPCQPLRENRPTGLRRRALLDIGHFDIQVEEMICLLPGACIVDCASTYLLLDLTDCVDPPAVGESVLFQASYWTMAKVFRNPSMTKSFLRDADLAVLRSGPATWPPAAHQQGGASSTVPAREEER